MTVRLLAVIFVVLAASACCERVSCTIPAHDSYNNSNGGA